MKRHGNLFNKICDIKNIEKAITKAAKGKKNYREVAKILKDKEKYALKIQEMLLNGTYKITEDDYKEKIINKGGKRKKERRLMKLKFYPHRIIQWAILLQTQHIFLANFCYHSCACVPCGGIARAHRLTYKYLMRHPEETTYCLKMDVRKYYDNISHKILKEKLATLFKDKQLLNLLAVIVDSY